MDFLKYLNLPEKVFIIIVVIFGVMQLIGELIELKGKVVPELFKVRKIFKRRKEERELFVTQSKLLKDVQTTLSSINQHYSKDNITQRDDWMDSVNAHIKNSDCTIKNYGEKLTAILIDLKRNTIIDFASKVSDENYIATREQFNRVFKLYDEYEEIIKENNLTNGEVTIAHRIIKDAYSYRLSHKLFLEDMRGYLHTEE